MGGAIGLSLPQQAAANDARNSDFAAAVENFSALSAQNDALGVAAPSKAVASPSIPGPITVSAISGRVVPPSGARSVMRHFDQVIDCAEVDLEIDQRMAILDNIEETASLGGLERFWRAHGLGAKSIALGADVPPLLLKRVPQDITRDLDVGRKKRGFVLMLLPHILAANDEIRVERARILNIQSRMDDPTEPTDQDIAWLFARFEKYGVKGYDFETLLARADVIPPALALAQAAKESGWGGSRFAKLGNALYGQWTWNPAHKGIVPSARAAGKTHRVRAFDSVLEATRAYSVNINTHGAYGEMREMRRDLRKAGKRPTGLELAKGLGNYSEIGQRYVRAITKLIKRNKLTRFNRASLGDSLTPPPLPEMFDGVATKFAANSDG